ncbi:hypothetical protein [Solimonas terrae]|uniref:Uncharacterized protein n=1 Tax=Solimonas terrae TaxID=1396819 RepID=A0A6M2BM98_9GAMM|nr:hypothetical protein [Solimonas terrae]NGY03716.1 hypothetical protein [Solimonas terrae]
MKSRHFLPLPLILCALSATVSAQDEMPAVAGPDAATKAIVARPDNGMAAADKPGTTIFGERESPIGLYITPWRDAHAEKDIDRPARLLQEKAVPIDRTVFDRQVEYYEVLTAELKKKGIITPEKR